MRQPCLGKIARPSLLGRLVSRAVGACFAESRCFVRLCTKEKNGNCITAGVLLEEYRKICSSFLQRNEICANIFLN